MFFNRTAVLSNIGATFPEGIDQDCMKKQAWIQTGFQRFTENGQIFLQ